MAIENCILVFLIPKVVELRKKDDFYDCIQGIFLHVASVIISVVGRNDYDYDAHFS